MQSVFEFDSPPVREETQTVFTDSLNRPAKVDHFLVHSFSVEDSHCFAVVCWPQRHPSSSYFGKPYPVWCRSLYECSVDNLLIPIENISSVLLTAECLVEEENVLVVVPVIS